jgi:regulator of cell morphogenesis and NO signaling
VRALQIFLAMRPERDDWVDVPLDELCKHLVDHHHERTRDLLGRAREILTESIESRPGRADLVELGRLLTVLEQDMSRHMVVEEMVLFPYIERLADGGVVEEPSEGAVRIAQHDHENATSLLSGIRRIAIKLADRDDDLQRLLDALDALELDLEEHSRLEDEVLFPRLDRLETHVARAAVRGTKRG